MIELYQTKSSLKTQVENGRDKNEVDVVRNDKPRRWLKMLNK